MSSNNYHFEVEEQLQDYCLRVLRQKGIPCTKELYLNGLRADIVTPDAVIECKKVLTRDAIWQAYGQAREYADRTGKPRVILVGQSPNSEKALNAAMGAADQLKGKAEVSFIDRDRYWQLSPERPVSAPEPTAHRPRSYTPTSSGYDLDWVDYAPWILGFFVLVGLASGTGRGFSAQKIVDASNCPEYAGRGGCNATNIRSSPNGAIVGSIENGTVVGVEKTQGQWCKTKSGWVFCPHLR